MKIAKGHYVPKELITSEAVHEAVVKVFVAAGFNPVTGGFICTMGVGAETIGCQITLGGVPASFPLNLQQLFTAENGLQWPTSAYRVVASATGVWFDLSQLPPVVISGVYSGGIDALVLATRQTNEKDHIVEADEMVSEWWDYENGCIIEGRYPPVGTKCKYKASAFKDEACEIVAVNYPEVAFTCKRDEGRIFVDEVQSAGFHPLDHATRKAEMERKELIQRAKDALPDDAPMIGNWNTITWVIERLVDTGVIRK